MKPCSKSPLILLELIYITLLPVLEAQEVKVSSRVTGYLGHDVTLPCTFIPGPQHAGITQVQWELEPPEGENILLIVFSVNFGVSVHNTSLKDRVELEEQSLIIRDVHKTDVGLYTCSVTTFPSGSFEGTTNLVVQDMILRSDNASTSIQVQRWMWPGHLFFGETRMWSTLTSSSNHPEKLNLHPVKNTQRMMSRTLRL